MKKKDLRILRIDSVSELHRIVMLPPPSNPLITVIDHAQDSAPFDQHQKVVLNLYNISIKRSFKGKMRYGKKEYDFDQGTMTFSAPNQVLSFDKPEERNNDGWSLIFHPDLMRNSTIVNRMNQYGFFSYEINEALHLSADEDNFIEKLVRDIKNEFSTPIDMLSGDILIAYLHLLLDYCNRFYCRQFFTRKMANNDLLSRFEKALLEYSVKENPILPTVTEIAFLLNVSPAYLSDMLRAVTGQTAQQHIHQSLIDRAKDMLALTTLSVAEIAFVLGFEHPQSFNKLFKNKTDLSPLKFRQSLN